MVFLCMARCICCMDRDEDRLHSTGGRYTLLSTAKHISLSHIPDLTAATQYRRKYPARSFRGNDLRLSRACAGGASQSSTRGGGSRPYWESTSYLNFTCECSFLTSSRHLISDSHLSSISPLDLSFPLILPTNEHYPKSPHHEPRPSSLSFLLDRSD
jgi:hypothetical protein